MITNHSKAKAKEVIIKLEAFLEFLDDRASILFIIKFDISRITRVPVKFDIKQLDYLNKLVLKKRWNAAGKLKSEMEYFLNKTHEHIPSSKQY